MLLYIVRHGLTPWNHLHKAQGSADIPLAQEGIDLARRTGEALMDVKFDICFTSPLTRARQTVFPWMCSAGSSPEPVQGS